MSSLWVVVDVSARDVECVLEGLSDVEETLVRIKNVGVSGVDRDGLGVRVSDVRGLAARIVEAFAVAAASGKSGAGAGNQRASSVAGQVMPRPGGPSWPAMGPVDPARAVSACEVALPAGAWRDVRELVCRASECLRGCDVQSDTWWASRRVWMRDFEELARKWRLDLPVRDRCVRCGARWDRPVTVRPGSVCPECSVGDGASGPSL